MSRNLNPPTIQGSCNRKTFFFQLHTVHHFGVIHMQLSTEHIIFKKLNKLDCLLGVLTRLTIKLLLLYILYKGLIKNKNSSTVISVKHTLNFYGHFTYWHSMCKHKSSFHLCCYLNMTNVNFEEWIQSGYPPFERLKHYIHMYKLSMSSLFIGRKHFSEGGYTTVGNFLSTSFIVASPTRANCNIWVVCVIN
jgi:hypothetical protein